MPAYVVSFDPSVNVGSRNGVESAVVFAASEQDAIDLLEAKYGDDINVGWTEATVTEIDSSANLIGWTLRVRVVTPEHETLVDKSITGAGAPSDTIDEIAALMVTALNTTVIDGAAYNSGSQVLKVAETTDNLGDHALVVEWYPPNSQKAVAGLVVTVVDENVAANVALTVTFAADSYVIPALISKHQITE